MKVRKISDVNYSLNLSIDDSEMGFEWKDGELYLTISGLILNDQGSWYELPLRDLKQITIINEAPIRLKLQFEHFEILFASSHQNNLMALRHFLQPFIDQPLQTLGTTGSVPGSD